jgi:hypothetical protein
VVKVKTSGGIADEKTADAVKDSALVNLQA